GLDPSFGDGAGDLLLGGSGWARGFAVDDSGQALLGVPGYPRSRVLRLNADNGAPVRSFGADGAILLPKKIWIRSLGFAKDGGAIVLGARDVSGPAEPGVLLSFRPGGKRDRTFGENGRLELRLPGGEEVKAKALLASSRGRILVAGRSGRRIAVASLLPNGKPDRDFSADGWKLLRAGGTVQSIALRRVGAHIYLAAAVDDEERERVVLVRFRKDGRLDRSFGSRGRRTVSLSRSGQPKAILPTPNGVLVVLNEGPKPLLFLSRNGQLHRRPVASRPQHVENVRATITGGQLVLGWNKFSREIQRHVHYLAKRPLSDR
ncbi:MAG TPA: hypothetical protein VFR75_11850, partial [Solirubrobacterales bacterium]|nr:hypothetical protein [Solirubrobacterales bacterium]